MDTQYHESLYYQDSSTSSSTLINEYAWQSTVAILNHGDRGDQPSNPTCGVSHGRWLEEDSRLEGDLWGKHHMLLLIVGET